MLSPPVRFRPSWSPAGIVKQLEKLASLMDRGLFTPDEFARQRAKLLGS